MEQFEDNIPEEFNSQKPLDLDSEWEEFNKKLSLKPEDELEQIKSNFEFDTVSADVLSRMRNRELPGRVIDGTPDTEDDLLRSFAIDYVEMQTKDIIDSQGELSQNTQIEIAVGCIFEYYKQRELQAQVINQIVICKYLLQKSNSHPLMVAMLTYEKKRLQAELAVHYRKGLEDPWQIFLDEEENVPGLYLFDPEDQVFIDNALASETQFHLNHSKRIELVNKAKLIMGINNQTEDLSRVIQVTGDLIEMQIIAADPTHTEHEKVSRNEQLWEYGRNNGFNRDDLIKIIGLFEKEY